MFLTDEAMEIGVFALTMHKNGISIDVVIDNFIPCNDDGEPAFAGRNQHLSAKEKGP